MFASAAAAAALTSLFIVLCPPAASAHGFTAARLSDGHVGRAKPELVAQLRFSRRVVSATLATPVRWRVALRHRSCWAHVAWSRVCDRGRRRLLAHRWLIRLTSTRLAALEPPPLAHERLWRCIAGYPGWRPGGGPGESWGNPRASNGSHFNVLQMTMPWGQGSYLVADPVHASAGEVMAAAERGYAANRHSRSWLVGQWGQTIGPCWDYV